MRLANASSFIERLSKRVKCTHTGFIGAGRLIYSPDYHDSSIKALPQKSFFSVDQCTNDLSAWLASDYIFKASTVEVSESKQDYEIISHDDEFAIREVWTEESENIVIRCDSYSTYASLKYNVGLKNIYGFDVLYEDDFVNKFTKIDPAMYKTDFNTDWKKMFYTHLIDSVKCVRSDDASENVSGLNHFAWFLSAHYPHAILVTHVLQIEPTILIRDENLIYPPFWNFYPEKGKLLESYDNVIGVVGKVRRMGPAFSNSCLFVDEYMLNTTLPVKRIIDDTDAVQVLTRLYYLRKVYKGLIIIRSKFMYNLIRLRVPVDQIYTVDPSVHKAYPYVSLIPRDELKNLTPSFICPELKPLGLGRRNPSLQHLTFDTIDDFLDYLGRGCILELCAALDKEPKISESNVQGKKSLISPPPESK
jgi:hypothetical protein